MSSDAGEPTPGTFQKDGCRSSSGTEFFSWFVTDHSQWTPLPTDTLTPMPSPPKPTWGKDRQKAISLPPSYEIPTLPDPLLPVTHWDLLPPLGSSPGKRSGQSANTMPLGLPIGRENDPISGESQPGKGTPSPQPSLTFSPGPLLPQQAPPLPPALL